MNPYTGMQTALGPRPKGKSAGLRGPLHKRLASALGALSSTLSILGMKHGLDHGAGHSILFGLSHGSLRWTERRWRDLNGCQDRRKH
jgi:hypothetical protein